MSVEVLNELRSLGQKYIALKKFEQSLESKIRKGIDVDDLYESVTSTIVEIQRIASKLVKEEPIYANWLHYVKGVGISHALSLYGYIDFNKAKTERVQRSVDKNRYVATWNQKDHSSNVYEIRISERWKIRKVFRLQTQRGRYEISRLDK